MSYNFVIADNLNRIRTARVDGNQCSVSFAYSKFFINILNVIKDNKYIDHYEVVENKNGVKNIHCKLKVVRNQKLLQGVKIVSKPGRRHYSSKEDLIKMQNDNISHLIIVSTSKGVMSAENAINQNIGGEVICDLFFEKHY